MPKDLVPQPQANVGLSEKIQILKEIFNEKFPVLPNSIDDNGKVKEANTKMLAQLLFNNNQTSKTVIDETLSKFLSKIDPNNKKTFDEIAEEIINEKDETKGNSLSEYFLPQSQKGYAMHLGPINPSTEDHFGVPKILENEDWEFVPSPSTCPTSANIESAGKALENGRC